MEGKAPLLPLLVVEEPWSKLEFDIVGPLPMSKSGRCYMLTCINFASRYPEANPLKRVNALSVANAMIERFGWPKELLSDSGGAFKAKLTQMLLYFSQSQAISISHYQP